MTKIIRHQHWLEHEDYMLLPLVEPYWNAYAKFKGFNKEAREWGIGIAIEAINEAQRLNKKIRIAVFKYGTYEITYRKCWKYLNNSMFVADHKILLVIPHSAFTHIETHIIEKLEREEDIRLKINQSRQIELL